MPKIDPSYKIRKSTILHVHNGTSDLLIRDFPRTKKELEASIVKDWIDYHKSRSREIFTTPSEYPDFIIKDNGVIKGLELRRLTSKTEERNQAISVEYRRALQEVYGKEFQFEFLPIKYIEIPSPKSKEGKDLFREVRKMIESVDKEGENWNLALNVNLRICFSLIMDTGLFNPQPLKEYYEEWYKELSKKWRSNFKVEGKGESLLILYRTGANLDENILKDMIKSLNKNFGDNFEEIWYLNAKSIGSIVTPLFVKA